MKPNLSILTNRTPRLIGQGKLFQSAVCIALIETDDGYDVLFEVRSNKIPDQPGDVCFPGGAVEPEETFEEAAVRETCEELLINPAQVQIICAADYVHAANTVIYPYVGILKDYEGTFSPDEVAEVFRVPLQFFLETEPERHLVDSKIIPEENFPFDLIAGGRNYKWRSRRIEELFYQYDGHVIWGLTARILTAFCDLL